MKRSILLSHWLLSLVAGWEPYLPLSPYPFKNFVRILEDIRLDGYQAQTDDVFDTTHGDKIKPEKNLVMRKPTDEFVMRKELMDLACDSEFVYFAKDWYKCIERYKPRKTAHSVAGIGVGFTFFGANRTVNLGNLATAIIPYDLDLRLFRLRYVRHLPRLPSACIPTSIKGSKTIRKYRDLYMIDPPLNLDQTVELFDTSCNDKNVNGTMKYVPIIHGRLLPRYLELYADRSEDIKQAQNCEKTACLSGIFLNDDEMNACKKKLGNNCSGYQQIIFFDDYEMPIENRTAKGSTYAVIPIDKLKAQKPSSLATKYQFYMALIDLSSTKCPTTQSYELRADGQITNLTDKIDFIQRNVGNRNHIYIKTKSKEGLLLENFALEYNSCLYKAILGRALFRKAWSTPPNWTEIRDQ